MLLMPSDSSNHESNRSIIERLKPQVKSACAIFIMYVVSYSVGVFYWRNDDLVLVLLTGFLKGILVFVASIFGLTFSRELNFEPLTLRRHLGGKKRILSWIILTFFAFLLVRVADKAVSAGFYPISKNLLHETFPAETFFEDYFGETPFFAIVLLIFAGAGIAEETLFRVFMISATWKLTRNPSLAVLLSSLVFGLYHLTPLDSLYQVFWGFPFFQLVTSMISGILLGLAYKKLGFESVVIVHTLMNIF